MSVKGKEMLPKHLSDFFKGLLGVVLVNLLLGGKVWAEALDHPAIDQPTTGQSAKDPSATEQPAADQPATDQPATDQPAAPHSQDMSPADDSADRILKVKLRISGPDNEWVRIEMNNNGNGETTLRAYHTKRVKQALWSFVATNLLGAGAAELTNQLIDGYDGPTPTPDITFYRWVDHPTRQLTFIPDSCSQEASTFLESTHPLERPSCAITGTESLTLPSQTDIHAGLFIIEYREEDLLRSIAFRIPS